MARVSFLFKTLDRYFKIQSRSCPYCGSLDSELLGRKKILLQLRRCRLCHLMYRFPKDERETSDAFYQGQYVEGMTTELPDSQTLQKWIDANFFGTSKDLSEKIRLVQTQQFCGRLLDYGCSWGYGVFQFWKAGFDVMGYEVSLPRVRFGRERLSVRILESRAELEKLSDHCFDVIFANHVLEHLYDPYTAFEDWQRLLKATGVLLVFVPNGWGENARKLGPRWGPMIGEKHPLAIDAEFLHRNLPKHEMIPAFCSSPYPQEGINLETEPHASSLSGDELLAVVRPAKALAKQSP